MNYSVKVGELPPFLGQELLLEAQRRGIKIVPHSMSFTDITLLGLANILVEDLQLHYRKTE